MSPQQPRASVFSNPEEEKMCCYSCHLKVIWDRMVPSCLHLQDQGQSGERVALAAAAAAGADARQLTLEEMLYPPPSWETAAEAATPSRRSSPKVCPVNLADFFSDEEGADSGTGSGGGYSAPGVNESASVSVVSRASLRRLHSVSRRVSFRSPDESDVFIIPARGHSDDDDEWSSDGEPSRT